MLQSLNSCRAVGSAASCSGKANQQPWTLPRSATASGGPRTGSAFGRESLQTSGSILRLGPGRRAHADGLFLGGQSLRQTEGRRVRRGAVRTAAMFKTFEAKRVLTMTAPPENPQFPMESYLQVRRESLQRPRRQSSLGSRVPCCARGKTVKAGASRALTGRTCLPDDARRVPAGYNLDRADELPGRQEAQPGRSRQVAGPAPADPGGAQLAALRRARMHKRSRLLLTPVLVRILCSAVPLDDHPRVVHGPRLGRRQTASHQRERTVDRRHASGARCAEGLFCPLTPPCYLSNVAEL